jgi:hypothetical protein
VCTRTPRPVCSDHALSTHQLFNIDEALLMRTMWSRVDKNKFAANLLIVCTNRGRVNG